MADRARSPRRRGGYDDGLIVGQLSIAGRIALEMSRRHLPDVTDEDRARIDRAATLLAEAVASIGRRARNARKRGRRG